MSPFSSLTFYPSLEGKQDIDIRKKRVKCIASLLQYLISNNTKSIAALSWNKELSGYQPQGLMKKIHSAQFHSPLDPPKFSWTETEPKPFGVENHLLNKHQAATQVQSGGTLRKPNSEMLALSDSIQFKPEVLRPSVNSFCFRHANH